MPTRPVRPDLHERFLRVVARACAKPLVECGPTRPISATGEMIEALPERAGDEEGP